MDALHSKLVRACTSGDIKTVERLLQDDRVDPSAHDNYAISLATREGHIAVVKRLLRDPRVRDTVNPTPELKRAWSRLVDKEVSRVKLVKISVPRWFPPEVNHIIGGFLCPGVSTPACF